MDLLHRLVGALTGGAAKPEAILPEPVEKLVPEFVDFVIAETDPRLKGVPGVRARLEPPVRRTLAYLVSVGELIPRTALKLSPGEWAGCPELNAIFPGPDDIESVLGNSRELQQYFQADRGATTVYAWLGAERQERRILGMDLSGDILRQEVPQTTVSFAHPRVAFPAATIQEARVELGTAILRGLVAVAMERIESAQARVKNLGEQKAMLQVRLRRLKGRGTGIDAFGAENGGQALKIQETEAALQQTRAELTIARTGSTGLDPWLAEVQGVLDRPEDVLQVEQVPVRVNRLGVQVEADATGPVNEFTIAEIRRPPDFRRIVTMVVCTRSDLPPTGSTLPG